MMKRKKLALAFLVLAVLVGAGWYFRAQLLSWYYVNQLSQAGEEERDVWVDRLAALGDTPLPNLRESLFRQDGQACKNAGAAIKRIAETWEADDSRRTALAAGLAEDFPRLSYPGQAAAIDLVAMVVKNATRHELGQIQPLAARLLSTASRIPENEVRSRVLVLAANLLSHGEASAAGCRDMIRAALEDDDPANRALAAGLAALPEVNLLSLVAPLLDDPIPLVRQAAMLAVGSSSDAIATDDLLRSLHDTDPDVRRLCEAALKSRGLRNDDVNLARMITDSRPGVRLQVLESLGRSSDLEPGVWLRRMSHDSSSAVRAAVLRAATEQYAVDLSERMDQMAQADPSPTVRQLAEHYLSRRKSKQSEPQNP